MRVSQWAEIRRLHEVEGLSQRAIARRLGCDRTTVRKALAMPRPPDETTRAKRSSILDPHKKKIDALVTQFPELSAVRIWEEIRKGPDGYTACEKGISVRYTRVVDMINLLTTAQINGTLEKALKAYVNPSLLLLDELGYLPIDKRGADLMFQVVAARYESGSIVITTNRAFRDWGKIFDVDNTLATAMIDRLMHHGEAFVIRGDSYRMKDKNDQE
jgi:hypothetical protein